MKKKRISIGACINMTFGVVLVLMLLSFVMSYQVTDRATRTGTQLYTEFGQTQGEVGMGFSYFQEVKCYLRNALYLYADDAEKQAGAVTSLLETREKMYEEFDLARADLTDEVALEILDEAVENIDEYIGDVDIILGYIEQKKIEEGRQHLLDHGVDSANAAAASINELIVRLDEDAVVAQKDFTDIRGLSNMLIGGFLFLSILCCVSGIIYLTKQIKNPVTKLAEAAGRVALGEVHVELPDKCNLRETAELHDAFEAMMKNLTEQAEVMRRIAYGDLRAEISAHSQDDAIGNALVKLLQDDNHTFNAIRNATNQISLGSSQIAAASQTLAQGSTEQASAIQQIAASITDIAGKTKTNANQADEVNQILLRAKDDVAAGNARMKEMVSAMREINEASENIQKIIKVIDDIAFNTNILALNATVEAARAGEQGKGFAVVAEEVRNLAGRSAEASSQTAEMIEDSIIKVKRGAELAQDTAEALRVISEMIEQITGLSEDIAKASNDQASATAQIDQALMQVSQVVQTNSATSEQCASASEELSGQARGLNQELSRFQLKDVIGNMPSHTLEYNEPEISLLENNMKY